MSIPDDFEIGVIMGFVLHVLLIPLTFALALLAGEWGGIVVLFIVPPYIGFIQLVYICPVLIRERRRGHLQTFNGICAAATITVLANIAFLLLMTSPAPEH